MLPGIGPKTLIKLNKLSIHTSTNLVYHFPHRYIDFSNTCSIADIKPDEYVTVSGQVTKCQNIYTKSGKNIQIVTAKDTSGLIDLVWFNQPYLTQQFRIGLHYSFAGKSGIFNRKIVIISPEYGQHNTGKIIPIYPEIKDLNSRWFRRMIGTNIDTLVSQIPDPIPPLILKRYRLPNLKTALTNIHLPPSQQLLDQARTRLAIDELLYILACSHQVKIQHLLLPPIPLKKNIPTKFIKELPFKLTLSQQSTWQEVNHDLSSADKLTNRIIVGDVGSGKTIIAILACLKAYINNSSSLVLAPTNILAQQHYATFKKFLPSLNLSLLTAKHRTITQEEPAIIIATHAAISAKKLPKISLLITDEQHKFGVEQRSFLSKSNTTPPHHLTMSATPIPRTIGLTLLNHLDISRIEPLPHHLKQKSFLVPNNKIDDCYSWIANQINQEHTQVFIVCPFIEESETLSSVKSATKEFENLSNIFRPFKLDLLHGKTPNKEEVIRRFVRREVDILVTTPIIEVGVDIPNANIIVVQSADRFGLSQLHQLRGRVGRSDTASFCYLFTNSNDPKTISRLSFFVQHNDGREIAEYDLKTRGPGEIMSTIQHGFPKLKLASITNLELIALCQKIFKDIDPSTIPTKQLPNITPTVN